MESRLYTWYFLIHLRKIIKRMNTNKGKTWNKKKYMMKKINHSGKVTTRKVLAKRIKYLYE